MPVILALRRLRKEINYNFKASLVYTARPCLKNQKQAGHQWLTPIISPTWEAKNGRISVQGQSCQIVLETSSPKITRAKWTGVWLKW
jgi:hypothetical protein